MPQVPIELVPQAVALRETYSRIIANKMLSRVDCAELRLTLEEARSIACATQPMDEAVVSTLHRQSDGWATGLTLMLERIRRIGVKARHVEAEITLGAEQLPMDTLTKFHGVDVGDIMLMPKDSNVEVLLLKSATKEPWSLQRAAPMIRQYLLNQKKP